MKKTMLLVFFLITSLFGCQYFSLQTLSEWQDKNKNVETVVYSGGSYSSGGNARACFWENTKLHDLKYNIFDSQVLSIFVNGNDIYSAGYCNNYACYWKNDNEIHFLSGNTGTPRAISIHVRNDLIFIGGTDENNDACYWSCDNMGNILKQSLKLNNASIVSSQLSAIYVDEFYNIYFAGFVYIPLIPTYRGFYWSYNNGFQLLESNSDVYSMFVSSGNVYLCGSNTSVNRPRYWKNGTAFFEAASGSTSTSINLSNEGDIFVACKTAGYLKNQILVSTTPINPISVIMFGGKLYVGGTNAVQRACYYIGENNYSNPKILDIPSGFTQSYITSMVVVDKKY